MYEIEHFEYGVYTRCLFNVSRSSHCRCSKKKGVLIYFAKLRKRMCRSLFFSKAAGPKQRMLLCVYLILFKTKMKLMEVNNSSCR